MADTRMAIQMLHDRILVRVPGGQGERTSRGGILIPATAAVGKRLVWGDVTGVGQGVRTVKLGDRVLYNPEDQLEVEISGETYLVMRERDAHAVATEAADSKTGMYL